MWLEPEDERWLRLLADLDARHAGATDLNGRPWAEHFRRVDMIFGIGYGDDIRKAESVLTEILEAHPAVLKDEAHQYMIKVHALGESSVDFAVRPWVKNEDYWNVYWDVTRSVKLRFDEEKITIPFPQRDVHIYQHGQA